ncbi:flagellar filament capping protein FliD [Desulfitobacterium sp. AusDCA]|uniref:flagellar filament capping protein FliD n=1 Tax=Desulfitobacterium sp. AusDCA TaxID=3240383 RepID=UPI003DA74659
MTISSISSNPLSSSNLNHTYGLSGSGIDVDSMVKKLMTAATVPYTQMWQKEQLAEWKKAEYNTFYNSINTFNTSTVFNYTLQSTTLPQIGTSSNTSVATVTANADAADINHSLKVNQLATGVTETSTTAITTTGGSKATLKDQFGLSSSSTFNISITNNGVTKQITVDPTQSINTLVSQINNAGVNVKANYDATLDRFFISTTNTGSTAKIDFSGTDSTGMSFITNNLKLGGGSIGSIGTSGVTSSTMISMASGQNENSLLKDAFPALGTSPFKLTLTNGTATKTLTVDPTTQTLNGLINDINNAGVNASASYDTLTGEFTLKAASGTLSLAGSDQAAFNFFTNNLNLPASGQDAQITLDGTDLTEGSNNFSISGVTYNLLSTGSSTITIAADIDKIVSNVQSFVDSYNTMLSSLTTEVSQSAYSDYQPLTDDQKSSMKDSDITAWTTKAKSGLLHSDSILQNAINAMRINVSDPISGLTGKYTSAASIGITTGDYSENGKLLLDTNKLKTALQADPTIVNKIFGTTGSSSNSSSQGIAVRLNNSLKNTISQIDTAAGTTADTSTDTSSNLAIQINDYKTRLTDMSTRLQDLQTRYYNEFDAMENALQQLNSQSSFISSLTSSSK